MENQQTALAGTSSSQPVSRFIQPVMETISDEPTRVTNQLKFLRDTLIPAIMAHPEVGPFKEPVNVVKFQVPDYYAVIRNPMDFGTIKERLRNNFYWSAKECINDLNTVFKNCQTYYRPGHEMVQKVLSIEKLFVAELRKMPEHEFVIELIGNHRLLWGRSKVYSRDVQPPVEPPSDRPGRLTNKLKFIKEEMLLPMWNHPDAWLFQTPIDDKKLNLSKYYDVVKLPMDFGTIKKRLENNFYFSATDCIYDLNLVFTNCNFYHEPGHPYVKLSENVEKVYIEKLKEMPEVEEVIE